MLPIYLISLSPLLLLEVVIDWDLMHVIVILFRLSLCLFIPSAVGHIFTRSFGVRLDDFIDIRKDVWKSED